MLVPTAHQGDTKLQASDGLPNLEFGRRRFLLAIPLGRRTASWLHDRSGLWFQINHASICKYHCKSMCTKYIYIYHIHGVCDIYGGCAFRYWNKSKYVYSIHTSYLYIHLHSQSCICTWYSRGTNFPLSPANWVPWRLTAWPCQTPAQIPLPPAARRGPCLQQAPGKLPSVWMEQVATSTNQTPKGKRYLCDYVYRICIFKCTNALNITIYHKVSYIYISITRLVGFLVIRLHVHSCVHQYIAAIAR